LKCQFLRPAELLALLTRWRQLLAVQNSGRRKSLYAILYSPLYPQYTAHQIYSVAMVDHFFGGKAAAAWSSSLTLTECQA